MAEHVMRTPGTGLQGAGYAGGAPGTAQARGSAWGTEPLRAARAGAAALGGNAGRSAVYGALGSPGRPLDAATRGFMEPRFGHDFGQVSVHANAKAGDAARALNARAFTVGRHVVFGAGEYAPETSAGRRLLAHELTHVVQQGGHPGGAVQRTAPGNLVQRQGFEEEEKASEQPLEREREPDIELPGLETPTDRLIEIEKIDTRFTYLFQQLQIADNESLQRALAWEEFYRNIGSAFANAMKNHEDAVDLAGKQAEARQEMIGAVLAVVGVGLGAYVSNLLQASKSIEASHKAIINNLEDAVQQIIEQTAVKIPVPLKELQEGIKKELPETFQNAYMNQVSQAHQDVLGRLISYESYVSEQQKWSKTRLLDNIEAENFGKMFAFEFKRMDSLEADVNKTVDLARASKMFSDPPEVDFANLQKEIERGVWVQWIPRMRVTRKRHLKEVEYVYTDYEWPEQAIEARFKDVGILRDAELLDVSWWTTYTWMAEELVGWAEKEYKPVIVIPNL